MTLTCLVNCQARVVVFLFQKIRGAQMIISVHLGQQFSIQCFKAIYDNLLLALLLSYDKVEFVRINKYSSDGLV